MGRCTLRAVPCLAINRLHYDLADVDSLHPVEELCLYESAEGDAFMWCNSDADWWSTGCVAEECLLMLFRTWSAPFIAGICVC